jgi:2-dehydro-3-deoxygluconokinase
MAMPLCLGIGELMVELAPSDSPDHLRRGFAGDVFNTLYYARMLMPADWQIGFHTAFGTDTLSDDMMDFIAQHNIDCTNTPRIEGRSPGLYMITLQDGERSFSYWRTISAARLLMRNPDLLAAKLADARFIYLSGITLAILSPADRQLLLEMIAQVRSADRTVFFDSNIREKLWPDGEEMRVAIKAAGAVTDIVLSSLDDEKRGFGDADAPAVADRYLGWGVQAVVIKDGAAPSLLVDGNDAVWLPPDMVHLPVDSTAAGDAFNAGLLAGMAAGKTIREAIPGAHALAAQVVLHPGALVPADIILADH